MWNTPAPWAAATAIQFQRVVNLKAYGCRSLLLCLAVGLSILLLSMESMISVVAGGYGHRRVFGVYKSWAQQSASTFSLHHTSQTKAIRTLQSFFSLVVDVHSFPPINKSLLFA